MHEKLKTVVTLPDKFILGKNGQWLRDSLNIHWYNKKKRLNELIPDNIVNGTYSQETMDQVEKFKVLCREGTSLRETPSRDEMIEDVVYLLEEVSKVKGKSLKEDDFEFMLPTFGAAILEATPAINGIAYATRGVRQQVENRFREKLNSNHR